MSNELYVKFCFFCSTSKQTEHVQFVSTLSKERNSTKNSFDIVDAGNNDVEATFDFVEKNRSTCSIRQSGFDIVAGWCGRPGLYVAHTLRCADVVRRRERHRRLLASIQSAVQPKRRDKLAATVTMATADDDADDVSGGAGPFMSADKAMTFTTTHHRVRRSFLRQGIVCECCVHNCELAELQGYCGSTPSD